MRQSLKPYWLATSISASRAAWMKLIKELSAWRMVKLSNQRRTLSNWRYASQTPPMPGFQLSRNPWAKYKPLRRKTPALSTCACYVAQKTQAVDAPAAQLPARPAYTRHCRPFFARPAYAVHVVCTSAHSLRQLKTSSRPGCYPVPQACASRQCCTPALALCLL